jgi:origin recognition complex subunit 6
MYAPTLPANGSYLPALSLQVTDDFARLKQKLNLPKIEPRPPCPPRIYKKLYDHLDTVLVAPRPRGRPPKSGSASVTSTPTKPLPHRPQPTKEQSLAPFRTTTPRTQRRGLQYGSSASTQDVAPWIHPTIRALCKELKAPAAAPNILAGVTTVLTQPSPALASNRDELTPDRIGKIPALIAAVYFFVCTRLSGKQTTGKAYAQQRKLVLNTLLALKEDAELQEKISKIAKNRKEDAWEGWEVIVATDVDDWLLDVSQRGWLKLDWFENIVEGSGLEVTNGTTTDAPAEDEDMGDEHPDNQDGPQGGMGSMMQDQYDYLSERRRAEYRHWKEGIIARIEQLEAEGGEGAMDTAEG